LMVFRGVAPSSTIHQTVTSAYILVTSCCVKKHIKKQFSLSPSKVFVFR
jgi:hypothetical protein